MMARQLRSLVLMLIATAGAGSTVGCSADDPLNPSFPLALDDARAALAAMDIKPKALPRPVLVLGGIHDPNVAAPRLAEALREATHDDAVIESVSFFFGADSFDECRQRVMDAAADIAADAGVRAGELEVDVVAVSMGGLVARQAAIADAAGERLRIARLFTIATPHRGADLALLPTLDDRIECMRHGSRFLADLDAAMAEASYDLVPYARLNDWIVGEANAAPPGRTAWWVAPPFGSPSHLGASSDPRLIADIARRLRGEAVFSSSPPAPLPGQPSNRTQG